MTPADQPNPAKKPAHGQAFQAPRGTRDFYPIEMARRLWLEDKWRRTAVRHGFDEIDGPTFEHLDLYTVKSGEGIVNELFSFTRAGGETPFALRPEFTPTLARMVATKANALPKPIKWFSIGPYFRAERPQRGRLREFLQWNVDVLGGDDVAGSDVETVTCCAQFMESVGLSPDHVKIKVSSRELVLFALRHSGVQEGSLSLSLSLLDKRSKLSEDDFARVASSVGLNVEQFDWWAENLAHGLQSTLDETAPVPILIGNDRSAVSIESIDAGAMRRFWNEMRSQQLNHWVEIDLSIVRGLAYYTGTVFEVHETTGAERAIAGGGRYDNLVELFGGPPTPAVGFAMGDVVISLVLQDKGLMPSDNDIARDLGLQPDAFVFAANDEADATALRPLLAHLRREGLHARRSYKSTRNIGKLLQDADKCAARFAVILESPTSAKVKDLGAATRTDGDHVTGADPAALAQAIAAKIPPK